MPVLQNVIQVPGTLLLQTHRPLTKRLYFQPLTSNYTNQGTDFTTTASLYDRFPSYAMTWEHVLLGRDWDF